MAFSLPLWVCALLLCDYDQVARGLLLRGGTGSAQCDAFTQGGQLHDRRTMLRYVNNTRIMLEQWESYHQK